MKKKRGSGRFISQGFAFDFAFRALFTISDFSRFLRKIAPARGFLHPEVAGFWQPLGANCSRRGDAYKGHGYHVMTENRPIYPIHPGKILADELEMLGLSVAELAKQIHVPASRIYQIVAGRRDSRFLAESAISL
ncbi:MAG: hypothetical protein H7834_07560 [Magnetococcus sp. YQC-9]